MAKIYRLITAIGFSVSFLFQTGLTAQDTLRDPVEAIRDLKQGHLVIRLPAFKNKIDTLTAMIARTEEGASKKRLTALLDEAIEERNSLREDYIAAFQNHYTFSKAAYFMDSEGRDLSSANYYTPEGEKISFETLHQIPVFYMIFSQTQDSKIEALIILDRKMKPVPYPFPNNFSRGGFNFFLINLEGDKYAAWRIKKINKKLHRFWKTVN